MSTCATGCALLKGVKAVHISIWRNGSGGLAGEYYYYFDGSGNVLGLVQGNGTLRASYTYEPFGGHDTATGQNGSLPNNPFRFAGSYTVFTDSSNHALLYKFGQRYYQPDQGRWTQPDSADHSGDPGCRRLHRRCSIRGGSWRRRRCNRRMWFSRSHRRDYGGSRHILHRDL